MDDPYHLDVIKDQLVRTPAAALPDVFDELNSAIPQYIPTKDDGTVHELSPVRFCTIMNTTSRLGPSQHHAGIAKDSCTCEQPSIRWPSSV